jgi:hypothetical protein
MNAWCVGGLLTLFFSVPRLTLADEINKKTVFQFNSPVEIPGRTLAPGKYVFEIADTLNLNVVQVFIEDSNGNDHLVDTVLAIPDHMKITPNTPIMTFDVRQSGRWAIRNWFYVRDNWGWKFIYPKHKE